MINTPKLLAVDPSLRQAGWALLCIETGKALSWGIIKPDVGSQAAAADSLQDRLAYIQSRICEIFRDVNLGRGDYLVCEGPAPVSLNPDSAIKVEQVRGIFETLARQLGVNVPGRLNPRSIQTELLGLRGKQLPRNEVKALAADVALRLFTEQQEALKNASQDIFDALLVGSLAQSRIKRAIQTGLSVNQQFAVKNRGGKMARTTGRGVRWSSVPNGSRIR